MAKNPEPENRPITVEELIARTSPDQDSFPRSGSPAARRAASRGAAAAKKAAASASGMPDHPAPAAKSPDTGGARIVGASGMPAYVPAPAGESANVVTGIIPVVGDNPDSDRSGEDGDTGSLRPVDRDDLLGEDLPTGSQAALPTAGPAGTKGVAAVAAERAADDAAAGDHLASDDEVAAARDAEAGDEVTEDDTQRSPVWSWLGLIGEVVLGLVIGAGLFWGFTVLWQQYVYLALVLAVLVIFATVTFAYVLRKRDLPTTLLALAVGLIVTIGPLVMLV